MTTKTTRDSLTLTQTKLYKDYKNPHNLKKEEIRLIADTFHYLLMHDIIENGSCYILPFKIGELTVTRIPVHGRGVFDYQLFKDTGIKRYHKNNNSSQEVAIFKWRRRFPYYKDLYSGNVYAFKASRFWKRYLASRMKSDKSIFTYQYDH